MKFNSYKKELADALKAAELAKREALKFFKNSSLEIKNKKDGSPVTEADEACNKVILDYLKNKYPDYGFLSEETNDDKSRLNKEYVWIVDPIDGTESFIEQKDDFSILIALSRNNKIVVGVAAIPAKKIVYFASSKQGAFKQEANLEIKQIHVSRRNKNLIAFKSPHHFCKKEEELLTKHSNVITKIEEVGSAYKLALIAEGIGDISYRLSDKSNEWDIAAPSIIIKEAGGLLIKPNKQEYSFNKEDVVNHEGYIVCNKKRNLFL